MIKSVWVILAILAIAALVGGCVQVTDGEEETANLESAPPLAEQPGLFSPPATAEGACPSGKDDLDGDGMCGGPTMDCDDTDPAINPNAQERCDGVDNDCDGKVDEGCVVQCYDECTPEGQYCSAGSDVLKKCLNADSDPCLELLEITCTYGCEGGTCRTKEGTPIEDKYIFARSSERPSESEALKTSTYTISSEPCPGSFLGSVEWNEKGSLCRKERFDSARRGYLTPLSCCELFNDQVECVRDMGEVPYQSGDLTFRYHEVGCYGKGTPAYT